MFENNHGIVCVDLTPYLRRCVMFGCSMSFNNLSFLTTYYSMTFKKCHFLMLQINCDFHNLVVVFQNSRLRTTQKNQNALSSQLHTFFNCLDIKYINLR